MNTDSTAGGRLRKAALVGGAVLAVAGAIGVGLRAKRPAPRPAPRAALRPAVDAHVCAFHPGDRYSLAGQVDVHTSLDLSQLLGGMQSQKAVGFAASAPQKVDETRRFVLDLEVVTAAASGGGELAARVRELTGNAGAGIVAEPGVDAPFRMRIDERCALVEFGWSEAAELAGARQQQALVASVSTPLPVAGGPARYTAESFDAVGRYRALHQWDGHVVQQRVMRYEHFFQSNADGQTRTRIERSSAELEPGGARWIARAERTLSLRFQVEGHDVGSFQLEAHYTPAPAPAPSPIPALTGTITWGSLLDRGGIGKLNEVARKPDERLRKVSLADALTEVRGRLKDAGSNPAEYVILLADWLRLHPDGAAEIVSQLKAGGFGKEPRLEAVLFHAMASANTPETRKELDRVFGGGDFAYGHRVNAAQVMVLLDPPPPGFVDKLIGEVRSGGDAFGRGSMQLALGMFAAQHEKSDPQLAAQARGELRRELTAAGDKKEALMHALQSAGNAAHDELYPDVAKHLADRRSDVREVAADALRNFSGDKALPAIDRALESERDDGVRARLFDAAADVVRREHRPPGDRLVADVATAAEGARSDGTFLRAVDFLSIASDGGDASAAATLQRLFDAERAKPGGGDPQRLQALGRHLNTKWGGR